MHFVCTDYALLEIEYAFDMVMIDTRKGYGMHRKGMRQGQRRHKRGTKKARRSGLYLSYIFVLNDNSFFNISNSLFSLSCRHENVRKGIPSGWDKDENKGVG